MLLLWQRCSHDKINETMTQMVSWNNSTAKDSKHVLATCQLYSNTWMHNKHCGFTQVTVVCFSKISEIKNTFVVTTANSWSNFVSTKYTCVWRGVWVGRGAGGWESKHFMHSYPKWDLSFCYLAHLPQYEARSQWEFQ